VTLLKKISEETDMRTSLPDRRKIVYKATKVISDIDLIPVWLAVRRES
jgi:hypothetical protein